MTKSKRHYPTPAELDERVSIPIPPGELVDGILKAGPHPDDVPDELEEAARANREYPPDETDEG